MKGWVNVKEYTDLQKERGGKGTHTRWKRMSKEENDEFNLIFFCAEVCGPWQIEPLFPPELAFLSATPHSTSSLTWPHVVPLLHAICFSSWPDGSDISVQQSVTAQSACGVAAIKPYFLQLTQLNGQITPEYWNQETLNLICTQARTYITSRQFMYSSEDHCCLYVFISVYLWTSASYLTNRQKQAVTSHDIATVEQKDTEKET